MLRSVLTLLSLAVLLVFAVGVDAVDFQILLDPGQEVPPPTLGGATPSGTATVNVDTLTGNIAITGGYMGMTSNVSGSHLHGFATAGNTAGVLIGLSNTGGTTGTFSGNGTFSSSDVARLLAGETYINIHTDNNGPGEIRGQVVDPDILVYNIALDPMQEIPPPNVAGFMPSGTAMVVVDSSTGEVEITGTYDGMTSNVSGSHLHGLAGPGATAGVLIGLSNTGGTSGTFSGGGTLGPADLAGLLAGDTYINIHTDNNGPGEIRGQVVPEPSTSALLLLAGMSLIVRRRRRP